MRVRAGVGVRGELRAIRSRLARRKAQVSGPGTASARCGAPAGPESRGEGRRCGAMRGGHRRAEPRRPLARDGWRYRWPSCDPPGSGLRPRGSPGAPRDGGARPGGKHRSAVPPARRQFVPFRLFEPALQSTNGLADHTRVSGGCGLSSK